MDIVYFKAETEIKDEQNEALKIENEKLMNDFQGIYRYISFFN